MRRPGSDQETPLSAQINLTPLIDMVFILLIFFIVTSKFTKESGVDVSRPQAESAGPQDNVAIVVGVADDSTIWIDGKSVDLSSVRAHIESLMAAHPKGGVILVADKSAPTGVTVAVLDKIRLAGVANVSIAAQRGEGS